jgi:anti-sigma regulatory factor (Ser/Thr protein kinase)
MSADFQLTLPAAPTAPSEARAALRPWLRTQQCVGEQVEVAELLTSELVSNAVRHTPSPQVTLTAVLEDDQLHVGVADCVPGETPLRAHRHPDLRRGGGRGLWLVEALAAKWGSDRRVDGKEVWFEIPCTEGPAGDQG